MSRVWLLNGYRVSCVGGRGDENVLERGRSGHPTTLSIFWTLCWFETLYFQCCMFNGNTPSFMITKETACTQWFSTLSACFSNGGKLLSAEMQLGSGSILETSAGKPKRNCCHWREDERWWYFWDHSYNLPLPLTLQTVRYLQPNHLEGL